MMPIYSKVAIVLFIIFIWYGNPYDPDFYCIYEPLGIIQILPVVEKYVSLHFKLSDGSFLRSFLKCKIEYTLCLQKIIYIQFITEFY